MKKNYLVFASAWLASLIIMAGATIFLQNTNFVKQFLPQSVTAASGGCNVSTSLGVLGYVFDTGSWQDFNLRHETDWSFGIHGDGATRASLHVDGPLYFESYACNGASSVPTCSASSGAFIFYCSSGAGTLPGIPSTCGGAAYIACDPTASNFDCLENV